MHFYPGVARYEPAGKEPLTVFINETTIRSMGPSFAAKPIFVEHVEEVDEQLDELHGKEDGWVIESFFNAADGKNWVKFIVVSERGLKAIRDGYRLSNAYIPQLTNVSGVWNGVPYQQEVTGGEFEHLAIVQHPRYEESVILDPEEYKKYCEENTVELKRLANSKENKGEKKMKLNIFKRTKLENSIDLDGMIVEGPKHKKEFLVTKAIEEYDKFLNMNGYANGDHMVKVGDKDEMSVNDLVKKHLEMSNELADMKKNAAGDDGGEPGKGEGADDEESMDNADDEDDESVENADDDESVDNADDDESVDNADDEDEDAKKKKENKMKNEIKAAAEKKRLAKEKALRLKNAHLRNQDEETVRVDLPQDQVARGKSLYGSGN